MIGFPFPRETLDSGLKIAGMTNRHIEFYTDSNYMRSGDMLEFYLWSCLLTLRDFIILSA